MIVNAIKKSFERAKEKKWDKTFWAVDIHDTIIKPNYQKGIPTEWYPFAKEALQKISKRKDICLILYTCSWPKEIEEYLEFFKENDIHFDYVNSNPEAQNTNYGFYDNKPYFNVLFEDKSGFLIEEWEDVIKVLDEYPDGYGLM